MSQGSEAGKVMGLDYGEVRIGVAISDELRLVARAVSTLHRTGMRRTLDSIVRLARELEARRVVIGLPKNMNGTQGPAAARVREFAEQLGKLLPVPVILVDERLSTHEVEEVLAGDTRARQRKSRRARQGPGRDAYAAAVILQRYLDGESGSTTLGGEFV